MIASEMSNLIELVALISLLLSIESEATAKRGHLEIISGLKWYTDLGAKAAVCKSVMDMSQRLMIRRIATATIT